MEPAGLVNTPLKGQDIGELMLEHLFGSKTRVRLMTLFLNKPEESFFIRELTRRIQTQINAVRREIDNLTKLGLIREVEGPDEEGNKRPGLKRKYYTVNPRFPLIAEIQALMSKSRFLMERRLDKDIAVLGDVSYAAFMGVFLGKTAPVDLFVVGDLDTDKLKRLVMRAEDEFGYEIKFTCLTAQEFKYRRDLADRFLLSVMGSDKFVAINTLVSEEEEKKV